MAASTTITDLSPLQRGDTVAKSISGKYQDRGQEWMQSGILDGLAGWLQLLFEGVSMPPGADKARSKFRSFINEPFAPVTACLLLLITLSYSGRYVAAPTDATA